jgi:hypothetical protein
MSYENLREFLEELANLADQNYCCCASANHQLDAEPIHTKYYKSKHIYTRIVHALYIQGKIHHFVLAIYLIVSKHSQHIAIVRFK